MKRCKSKYPRFFIPHPIDHWYHGNTLYFRINKIDGDIVAVLRSGHKEQSSWTESGCESNVKLGFWQEISEEEAALL